jgi:hypothetical protein
MTVRHKILTGLAALHLVLVACGACREIPLDAQTAPGHALRVVRGYTGSDANYGFFAPGVSSQMRVLCVMTDAHGKEWTDTIDGGMSREAQLRINSGIGTVGEFPELTRQFGASWAAAMFSRHPTARRVVVLLQVYDLPTMEQYAAGAQPEWKTEYAEVFDPR